MPFYLPRSVRSLGRVQTVARVLAAHGFGHFVERLDLAAHLPLASRWRRTEPVETDAGPRAIGRRLAAVAEDLGPTYVKLGQMVSTRPDLLPASTIEELNRLQDNVSPFPTDEARRLIELELGQPVAACFSEFPDAPMASGSIAQVYAAKTISGRPVVVKVRRPGIEETIRLDLTILRWLCEGLEGAIPEVRNYRPRAILDEFERTIQREMDFVYEASSISRFGEALRDFEGAIIPEVIWDLTGPNVLTMDRMTGESIRGLLRDGNGESTIRKQRVARTLAELFFRQFFELGMFHADPHPGNIFISSDDRVGLIDFGMVGQVDDEMATQLAIGLVAVVRKDIDLIVDVLAEVGAVGSVTDEALLRRDLRELLDKYYGLPLWRLDFQTIFHEVTEIIRERGLTLPRDFVMLLKSLVMVTGVALELDPQLNLLDILKPRMTELMRNRFSPTRVLKSTGMTGWHILNVLRTGPKQLRRALRRMSRGEWQVNIRHQNLDHLANELDRSSNRLSFAVVIAAIIVGSSMIVTSEPTPTPIFGLPLPALGLAGYLFAGIMGVALVWAIWRSGKMS